MRTGGSRSINRWGLLPVLLAACGHAGSTAPAGTQAPTAAPAAPPSQDAVLAAIVQHLNDGDGDALFALFNDQMRAAVPLEQTRAFVTGLRAAKGKVVGSRPAPGSEQNHLLTAERGEWLATLTLDSAGRIAGLRIQDPPPPGPSLGRNQVPLALPFEGRWTVIWGGDRPELNHHVGHASQRRAADLVVMGADGRSFRDAGSANQDYFAYGKPIRAVADGVVTAVVDGIADNTPGKMNPYFAPGNTVIVEHAPQLFSVYAHLQPRSIRVKPGAAIKQKQVLGLCGNSGNSSEPHLHFQLQDGPLFERSWGVEAAFAAAVVERDGARTRQADYTFRKGDVVSAAD